MSPATASTAGCASSVARISKPTFVVGPNKYIWLGTSRVFDAFTFAFEHTDDGWIWCHAYGFDGSTSTFIVECSPETWTGLGFDTLDEADCIQLLETVFERHLQGHGRERAARRRIVAQLPDGHEREVARGRRRADGGRRAHDALHDRVGHETRARGCDLAGNEAAGGRRAWLARSSDTKRSGERPCRERRATPGSAPGGSRAFRVTSIWSRRRSSPCSGTAALRFFRAFPADVLPALSSHAAQRGAAEASQVGRSGGEGCLQPSLRGAT